MFINVKSKHKALMGLFFCKNALKPAFLFID